MYVLYDYVLVALANCVSIGIVFLLWITISARTIPALIDGSIFNAPCIAAAPASANVDLEGGLNSCETSGQGVPCFAESSGKSE